MLSWGRERWKGVAAATASAVIGTTVDTGADAGVFKIQSRPTCPSIVIFGIELGLLAQLKGS